MRKKKVEKASIKEFFKSQVLS